MAASGAADTAEEHRISGRQSLLAAGHLLKESLAKLEELDIDVEAFHGSDELEQQLQAHAEHPELAGTQTLTDLTQAARAIEAGSAAASDEEFRQLSKTLSEILESGESTSAQLDEPIDAIEKVAIDAYAQVYGNTLTEAFDREILRKALIVN